MLSLHLYVRSLAKLYPELLLAATEQLSAPNCRDTRRDGAVSKTLQTACPTLHGATVNQRPCAEVGHQFEQQRHLAVEDDVGLDARIESVEAGLDPRDHSVEMVPSAISRRHHEQLLDEVL